MEDVAQNYLVIPLEVIFGRYMPQFGFYENMTKTEIRLLKITQVPSWKSYVGFFVHVDIEWSVKVKIKVAFCKLLHVELYMYMMLY